VGKKSRKKKEREGRAAEKEAARLHAEAARSLKRRRTRALLTGIPIATVALAVIVWLALGDRRLTALVVVAGLACWIPILLGAIGSEIPARDRARAGSIDFGRSD
jgi:VIT1/CCC1 family predicted Fe2+/Mn2+ transporter